MSLDSLDVIEASIAAVERHKACDLFAEDLEFLAAVRRVEFYSYLDEDSRIQFVIAALQEEYLFCRPDLCKFWLQMMRHHLLQQPVDSCIDSRVDALRLYAKIKEESSPQTHPHAKPQSSIA